MLLLTLDAALAAWTRSRLNGTSQSFLLLATFASLAVLYAPHALLEADTFDPAHLVFGPLARLAFSLGLIAAVANAPLPGLHRLPRGLLVGIILLAMGLTDRTAPAGAAVRPQGLVDLCGKP